MSRLLGSYTSGTISPLFPVERAGLCRESHDDRISLFLLLLF